jgi:hypothetical protein
MECAKLEYSSCSNESPHPNPKTGRTARYNFPHILICSCRDALLAAGPVAIYDRREFLDGCPAPPSAHLAASVKLPQIVRKLASSTTPAVQQTAKAVELNFPAISGFM